MKTDLFVSFVLLEYNSLEDIAPCIASIREKTQGIAHEVIVSSNSNYPAEKQSLIAGDDPSVKWVFNTGNLGFAGGMNSGIRNTSRSSGFIVIMNQDVRIVSNKFGEVLNYFRSHPETGIIGTRIINKEGELQDTFRKFITPHSLVQRQLKRIYHNQQVVFEYEDHSSAIPVDWVCGGFMVIARDVIDSVGLLDENYFLYVEDMDWCYRVKLSGKEVVYYPMFTVEYQGDRKSIKFLLTQKLPTKYFTYHLRSYFYFLRKNRLFSRKNLYRKLNRNKMVTR